MSEVRARPEAMPFPTIYRTAPVVVREIEPLAPIDATQCPACGETNLLRQSTFSGDAPRVVTVRPCSWWRFCREKSAHVHAKHARCECSWIAAPANSGVYK